VPSSTNNLPIVVTLSDLAILSTNSCNALLSWTCSSEQMQKPTGRIRLFLIIQEIY
jgi:hypothetical protein